MRRMAVVDGEMLDVVARINGAGAERAAHGRIDMRPVPPAPLAETPAVQAIARAGDRVFFKLADRVVEVEVRDPDRTAMEAGGAEVVAAAMPGTVVSLSCAAGDAVSEGQTLMVIESMKLQTTIIATHDGTIGEVHVEQGGTFNKGAPLVTFAAEEEE